MKDLTTYINEYYYRGYYPRQYTNRNYDDDKPRYPQNPLKKLTFKNYEDITDDDVDSFWEQADYQDGLIPKEDIRKEWKDAYDLAKKNIAMYSYVLNSHENIFFNKDGNLLIDTIGASHKRHLNYYNTKFKNFFNTEIGINYVNSPYKTENKETWEMIYKGKTY